jgi:hypothetical protein
MLAGLLEAQTNQANQIHTFARPGLHATICNQRTHLDSFWRSSHQDKNTCRTTCLASGVGLLGYLVFGKRKVGQWWASVSGHSDNLGICCDKFSGNLKGMWLHVFLKSEVNCTLQKALWWLQLSCWNRGSGAQPPQQTRALRFNNSPRCPSCQLCLLETRRSLQKTNFGCVCIEELGSYSWSSQHALVFESSKCMRKVRCSDLAI